MEAIQHGFFATEFVPKEIFDRYGVNSWWFIDERIVRINAELKKDFNRAVIINNWSVKGTRQYCGYRPPTSIIGGKNSQHRHGRASDTIISGIHANEVREWIMQHKERYMQLGLTTLEHQDFAPTWVHLDCRWTGLNDILIVKP
ncbi:MAG: hypothetical protein KF872_05965 [Chitinophagales bacterium]|nr:hypothetical protein [Chitinophagales bacterium]